MRPSVALALALALATPRLPCAHRCNFGTTPGTFLRLEHGVRRGRGGGIDWLGYNRLTHDKSVWLDASTADPEVPFGSNWVSLDPLCPLRNLLDAALRSEAGSGATIVLLGDSVDSYFVDFLCGEAAERGVAGWKAWVHSHTLVNYCLLPSGVRIVQIYLLSVSQDDDLMRLDTVRRLFHGEDDVSRFDGKDGDRSVLQGRPEEVSVLRGVQPDLVVFASAYWPLQNYAGAFGEHHTPLLLPFDFVAGFVNRTQGLLAAARAAFPHAQLAVHTSAGIRTDPIFGSNVDNSNHRIWGRKTYVAQLNAALRVVAAAGHAKLVDFELMAASLTAAQLTVDDVHPRSFFSLEVVNVYLNMIAAHREHGESLLGV